MMLATIQNVQFRNLLLSWPEKAIKFIYEAYYDNLLIISQRLTRDFITAEDVVQEVFAEIWHNHKRFARNNEQAIEYYLIRAVKRKSVEVYREKVKSDSARIRKAMRKSDFPTDADILRIGDSECLQMIVERFTKYEQRCFQLKYKDRMAVEQIASSINRSNQFVERRLFRVKRKIKSYHWVLT
ncbi:MAG: sigma-70 family RNA polymerase sigma factor [Chryseolinea sp.]